MYDHAVSSRWCGHECSPNIVAEARKVIHVVHLEGSGPPSVVLDLYSGGAHCCFIEQVYSLQAKPAVVHKAEYNFGNPGVRLMKLITGSYGFLSANNDFAYAFTDYAASGMPIAIFSFSDNAFHNVTVLYPGLIQKDANQFMNAFQAQARSHYEDSVGVVAAWAADEDLLGRSAARLRSRVFSPLRPRRDISIVHSVPSCRAVRNTSSPCKSSYESIAICTKG